MKYVLTIHLTEEAADELLGSIDIEEDHTVEINDVEYTVRLAPAVSFGPGPGPLNDVPSDDEEETGDPVSGG